jgi:uncharacterized protein (DUF1800 family)
VVTTSDGDGDQTLQADGYLPNDNAASRFLSQAALGHGYDEIADVMTMGLEDWIVAEIDRPRGGSLATSVEDYLTFARTETGEPNRNSNITMWYFAWWQYHMQNDDLLRQRVAFVLSQILVISSNSGFSNNGFALADYYDILLDEAFGNYRDLLQRVTYHASMGVYLTYLNNPKTDLSLNRFPDENYARELMQLFTIGTTMLNMDGSEQLDAAGLPIAAYDNNDISELSKVFTGLSWGDRSVFGRNRLRDTSYQAPMQMFNAFHEPGPKTMIDGTIIDNSPTDGDLDITQAIDILFDHPNVPPFIAKLLIQRLVTDNPSPQYIQRVAEVFADDGTGERGNLAAVISAVLLDPVARSCNSGDDVTFGTLREPFIRYMQMQRAFGASTASGNHRNTMSEIYEASGQRPLNSPSVFNFYQQDYQPIGAVEDAGLVSPVFQITDTRSITGYVNALWKWIYNDSPTEPTDLYGGEDNATYADEVSTFAYTGELDLVDDDELHILVDRWNMLLAQGRLSPQSEALIVQAALDYPMDPTDVDDRERRLKIVAYLILSCPEYLINR